MQTGRELYTLSAYREDEGGMMLLNFYMVSEEYARDSFDEVTEKDGYRIVDAGDEASGWYVTRVYDPRTSLMMDASGTYKFDWESIGLFDAVR